MSAFSLAWRYLHARRLLNLLTALTVALGVTLVVASAALSGAGRDSVGRTTGGYQLLVAAKGSPLQAVLSSLFFIDEPTGLVPASVWEKLSVDAGVARSVPLNMGDSHRGFPVVGTTPGYFDLIRDLSGQTPRAEPPRGFERPFEAVLGAVVARQLGLAVGDQFNAAHGMAELPADLARTHDVSPYTVVAVLQPTGLPMDRVIFTTLETTWLLHGLSPPDAAERGHMPAPGVTALLLQGHTYADMQRLAALAGQSDGMQAIFPARIVTRLLGYLNTGEQLLTALCWLLVAAAGMAVAISMLAATIERRRQIATLRALGASPGVVARVVLYEAGLVALTGACLGVVAGRLLAHGLAWIMASRTGLLLEPASMSSGDVTAVLCVVAIGLTASALPAWSACRQDIASHLVPSP